MSIIRPLKPLHANVLLLRWLIQVKSWLMVYKQPNMQEMSQILLLVWFFLLQDSTFEHPCSCVLVTKCIFPVLASVLPLTWRRKDNFVRNLRSSSWWHYFVIFWMKSRDMRFIDGFREAVSIQKEHTLPSFARTYHSNDRSNMQILCKMYHFICILMLIRVMIFVASARDFVLKTEVSHH